MIFSSVIYLYRGEDIVTDKMFNDIIDSIINNATDDEIEIIREKLNNHIINHVYDGEVHKELSDEFDSSSCPHCGHEYIIKYGKDKNGNQRYLCKHCHKTFSPMTGTLFSYSKKEAFIIFLPTKTGDSFATFPFFNQLWDIQDTHTVIDCKVKTLYYTAGSQTVHHKIVPASLLRQQIAFHLATAFPFHLHENAQRLIVGNHDFNIAQMVALLIAVSPVILMEKIFLFKAHDALYHGQCLRSGETHLEIINEQEQRFFWIETLYLLL